MRDHLQQPWPSPDRICHFAVVALLVLLAVYAAFPGAAQELAPLDRPGLATRVAPPLADFELPGESSLHAAGGGSWCLLAAVMVTMVVGFWLRGAAVMSVGLLLTMATACPLAAANWVGNVSVNSALRWWLAAYVVVASFVVWFRSAID